MGKPAFCKCENKDADQLRGYREADQRLCFRYTDSIIPLLPFKPLVIFCSCTARFVSDQVRNTEDRFFHNEAQICSANRVNSSFPEGSHSATLTEDEDRFKTDMNNNKQRQSTSHAYTLVLRSNSMVPFNVMSNRLQLSLLNIDFIR